MKTRIFCLFACIVIVQACVNPQKREKKEEVVIQLEEQLGHSIPEELKNTLINPPSEMNKLAIGRYVFQLCNYLAQSDSNQITAVEMANALMLRQNALTYNLTNWQSIESKSHSEGPSESESEDESKSHSEDPSESESEDESANESKMYLNFINQPFCIATRGNLGYYIDLKPTITISTASVPVYKVRPYKDICLCDVSITNFIDRCRAENELVTAYTRKRQHDALTSRGTAKKRRQ